MKKQTPRQRAILKALRNLVPKAPYADFVPIATQAQSKHMRNLLPVNAVFLATVAHIRHQHTDYDAMRDEGYDHDSARYFVADVIDEVLEEWGSSRGLETPDEFSEMDPDLHGERALYDDPAAYLTDRLENEDWPPKPQTGVVFDAPPDEPAVQTRDDPHEPEPPMDQITFLK